MRTGIIPAFSVQNTTLRTQTNLTMAQTLLAVLALMLASLVSFNQQRNSAQNYSAMVQNEVEMAAAGTITHVIELISSRSFDERSTPDAMQARNYLPSFGDDFNAATNFGSSDRGSSGCDLLQPFTTPECDDVDDLDGMANQVITAELSTGRSLPFTVDVDVEYVLNDTGTSSDHPTLHKLVTVHALSEYLPNGGITLQRVISYDPVKAEMEYEEVYGPLEGGGLPYGNGGGGSDPCNGEIC